MPNLPVLHTVPSRCHLGSQSPSFHPSAVLSAVPSPDCICLLPPNSVADLFLSVLSFLWTLLGPSPINTPTRPLWRHCCLTQWVQTAYERVKYNCANASTQTTFLPTNLPPYPQLKAPSLQSKVPSSYSNPQKTSLPPSNVEKCHTTTTASLVSPQSDGNFSRLPNGESLDPLLHPSRTVYLRLCRHIYI